MFLSWWQNLVNRGKLKLKSSPARRLRRRRTESRRNLFEPLESRVLLSSGPVISLTNGLSSGFIGGQGDWVQIPVRIDHLTDASGDVGLSSAYVALNFGTTVNVAAQNISQPAESGFTESGHTVSVITQSASGFVVGESVNIDPWNNPQYAGIFSIASVGDAFTLTSSGSGTFSLTYGGVTATGIAYNASPASGGSSVQSILNAAFTAANSTTTATVTGSAGNYSIYFSSLGTLTAAAVTGSPNPVVTQVGGGAFTYTDSTYANMTASGGGTATASFFDQGAPQTAASEQSSITSGTPNFAPVVVWGTLVPTSGTNAWQTGMGGDGAGSSACTIMFSAADANQAQDITTTDPTNGGTSPDGDILAYVFLHVVSGTASSSYDSSIPVNVVSGGTTLVADGATGGKDYSLSSSSFQDAKVDVVPNSTAPVTELSVNTTKLPSSGVTGDTTYTVPLMLDPSTPGGQGISTATADILFDPTYINNTGFKVSAGTLLPSSWTKISATVDTSNVYSSDGIPPSTDTNCLILQASIPGSNSFATVASNSAGSLWVLTFTTMPGVSGSTVLNLVPDAQPSVESPTALSDASSGYSSYTFSPAPTWNEAPAGWTPQPAPYSIPSAINPVDGIITFASVSGATTTTTVSTSNSSVVYGTAVTLTASVTSGSAAPTGGSVEFETTTGSDLAAGTFVSSSGDTSTWTYTGNLSVMAANDIEAVYTPGTGFQGSTSTNTVTQAVTPATLTVTGITAANKTYNGNTTATLGGLGTASLSGVVSGDTVTLGTTTAAGTFASKDVGQNITVSVSGLTLGGAEASDYTLTQPTTTANITVATLTVTGITAANKTYNGNATAALQGLGTASLSGVASGDTVTLGTSGATGTFASKNAGTGITVSVTGLTVSGTAVTAGDYTLTQPTTTANITAATLTVTEITAANKTYNGNTTAALQGLGTASLSGVVSGDTVTLGTSGATGTFASKDVGTGITVSVAGLTVSGTAVTAGDYTLTQPTTTANITAATLTVTGITAANKTYNGNTTATLQGLATASLSGVASGDTVTLGTSGATGTFASKDVGTGITVSVAGLTVSGTAVTAGDYTLTQPTTTANITAATLTVTGITAANKTYNGNTTAALQGLGTASLAGVASGDTVTLGTSGATGTFASKDAGTGITVSVAGLTVSGTAVTAGDYTLTQPTTTANITAATLTVTGITAANKTYNGNATAALQGLATASLSGVVSGDTVTLGTSGATGTFASKDVGTGITVSVAGLTVSGTAVTAGDYTLTQPTTTANITAATLTVTGITAANKTYNGNTTATLQGLATASLSGVASGDTVTLGTSGATGTFASKDVGTGITVSVAGLTVSGTAVTAGDYTLTQPTTTANITAATLTVTGITAANKTYNGNTTAALQGLGTASLAGVASGDTVTLGTSGATGTFASKDAGTGITVSVAGLTVSGTAVTAGDYTLTQPTTTANITAATLTVTGITAANKTYNGNATAALQGLATASLSGVVSGDTVTLGTSGATGTFASKDAGTGITVSVAGLTVSGTAVTAGDYTLTQPTTTANITAATLTVTGITAANKTYNGNTTATLQGLATASLSGVASGDTVTLGTSGATGTFASKDVGTGITVSVAGLTVSGTAVTAGDYTLTQPTTTANITAATLTVTGITAANKTYNGNTTAALQGLGTASLAGVASGDTVTLGTSGATGTFASKDAGTGITVSVAGLTVSGTAVTAGDYTLTQPATTANITAATLTVTGITAANKTYDGTTTATLQGLATASLSGVVSGDTVTLGTSAATGTFASKDVGTGITVSVAGLTVSGTAVTAGDYTLTQPSTTANITKATLTVTATCPGRNYVASDTNAPVTLSDNRVAADQANGGASLIDNYTSATFSNSLPGSNKTVTVTGISITGSDAGDYTLSSNTATTKGTISNSNAVSTTTTVSSSNGSVVYGTSVTFTATVSAQSGTTPPTAGTVDFYDTTTSTDLGDGTLSGTASAASTWTYTPTTNLNVTAGDTITATYENDLNFNTSSGTTTQTVTARHITVTGITAANKTYNGNATATLQGLATASLSGVVSGDTVTLGTTGATGTFASKDVGQNITVSVTGLTLGGSQAEDYSLTQPTTTANITPATLTVTGITAANKTYNGNATAALQGLATASLSGVVSGDTVTLGTSGATGTFASKDVGQNITVSVAGLTVSGTAVTAGDYSLTQPTTTANITPATLTVTGITAANKTYNGNATAALQGLATASLSGVASGDTVTLGTSGATGTFASKNVGQNITVSVTGLTVSGTAVTAGDYTLTQPTTTANITPATLTVTGITAANKTYNGNATAALQGLATASLSGVASGDTVTLGTSGATGTFASKDAGTGITVSVAGLTVSGTAVTAGDYTLTQPTTTANITPATLTVTGITAANKTYNGNATAALQGLATASLSGVVSGDTVTLGTSGATGTFASKDVGAGITVSVAGLTVSGTAVTAGDYSLTQPTTTANITPATLTVTGITAANKTYNGNATAVLQGLATASLSGVASGDTVTLGTSGATGTFASKNVGAGITVSVTGLTVSGTPVTAGDYTLTQPTATANITPATLTVTGITAANKTYNGNATATLQGLATASLSGVASGDTVTLGTSGATGTFASKDAGTGITVSVAGLTVSGTAVTAGDYTLTQPTTTANITAATLTVTGITAANKTYNGNATAALHGLATASLSGVVSGDTVTLGTSGATGTFASKDVGQNLTVSVAGLTVSGTAVTAGDYTLTQPTTTANITPATLTVTGITAADKTYDGTTAATLQGLATASLSGVASGDTVTLGTSAATGTFASKDVGQNFTVSVAGLTVSGTAVTAGDYTLTQPTTTANITALAITVTAVTDTKTYDGTTSASVTPTITGNLGANDTPDFTETFNTRNAGAGETLTPVGSVNDGNGGHNYAVTPISVTTGSIAQLAITVTATANTKNYDGSTSSSALPTVTPGVATGDTAAFTETYDTPATGTGKTLTPAGSVNDGNGGNNYLMTVVDNYAGAIINSTPADLTIADASSSSVASGHDVVYTLTLSNIGSVAAQGVIVTDTLSSYVSFVSGPVPTGFTASTPAPGTWGGTVTFTAIPSFSFAPGAKPITFTIVAYVSPTVASNTAVKNTVALSSLGSGTPLVAPGGHLPSASVTAQVNVAGASLGASSLGNGKEDLTIYGTAGSNFIYVLPTTGNKILVIENGHTLAPVLASSITGRIVVYACGSGTNVVYISPLLAESAWIDGDGGTGNDIFYADSGNCVLVGGSGRNELISGRGDNILIGGSGAGPNIILGTQGNNVEISGSTSYDDDAHDVAMAAILAEWSSTDSYTKRVQCLNGTSTAGQNGASAFTSGTITRGTGLGYLFGGVGENTYFARQTGPVRARDYVFGHKSLEVITTI
jgi:hypothetical protein